MRISDWSSDVCSSDLVTLPEGAETDPALDVTAEHQGSDLTVTARLSGPLSQPKLDLSSVPPVPRDEIVSRVLFNKSAAQLSAAEAAQLAMALRDRSEEHTSELQSLMRISYADFCLKKKK